MNVIYFAATLFEVQAPILVQLITFQKNFFDFCFVMFSQILVKELTHMLIYVRKIFNCNVSFKTLLSMCLIIVEEEL